MNTYSDADWVQTWWERLARAAIVLTLLTVYYALVGAAFAGALGASLRYFAIGGASAGVAVGLISGLVVSTQTTKVRARMMMSASAAIWGTVAFLLLILAGAIWIIRSLFF